MLLIDLKPDSTVAVEGLGRGAGWGLGHVELQRTRMLDTTVDTEANSITSIDVLCPGTVGTGLQFVASNLTIGYVLDGAVGVVVGCLPDKRPVSLRNAIVYQAGLIGIGQNYTLPPEHLNLRRCLHIRQLSQRCKIRESALTMGLGDAQ